MLKPFKKARAAHLKLGKRGENAACALLREKGLEIILRNYKCRRGEIDIIARDGAAICFVEVKTRSKKTGRRPSQGLTDKQKRRIYRASKHYLKEVDHPNVVTRYDLIELIYDKYDFVEARHWARHFSKMQKREFFIR